MMDWVTPRLEPARRALAPSWYELWSLVLLVTLYLFGDVFVGSESHATLNLAGPVLLSLVLAHGGWRMVRSDPKHLWTALIWFRLSTLVFFGVGSYLAVVINPESRQYLESFFWFFDQDVFKLNLVVALGVLLTLGAARITVITAERIVDARRTIRPREGFEYNLPGIALGFLAVGLFLDYTLRVPYALGRIEFEIPGAIMNLTRLKLVGFFLVTVWALQQARWFLPIIAGIVFVDLSCQALLFAKGDFLISLMMFLMAFLWEKATVKRLLVCGILVAASFGTLQPIITDGREVLERRYGDTPQAGLTERYQIIRAYFTDERPTGGMGQGASALTRLTYVNAGTLVINQYDAGQPADWPSLLPAVFIPRLLWPDKPTITDVGRDIYELGTGRRTSQSGAGVFADAYWARGWWGLVVFMPVYGALLGIFTVMGATLIRERRWLYFPVVVMAMRIGFRTDGHFLADVAGGSVILMGTFAVLALTATLLRWLSVKPVVPARALMR